MIETTMARPLLALLRVSDSLFPIGGFGYSDGLEAATAAGLVETPADRGRGADGRCRRSRNKRRIDSARLIPVVGVMRGASTRRSGRGGRWS